MRYGLTSADYMTSVEGERDGASTASITAVADLTESLWSFHLPGGWPKETRKPFETFPTPVSPSTTTQESTAQTAQPLRREATPIYDPQSRPRNPLSQSFLLETGKQRQPSKKVQVSRAPPSSLLSAPTKGRAARESRRRSHRPKEMYPTHQPFTFPPKNKPAPSSRSGERWKAAQQAKERARFEEARRHKERIERLERERLEREHAERVARERREEELRREEHRKRFEEFWQQRFRPETQWYRSYTPPLRRPEDPLLAAQRVACATQRAWLSYEERWKTLLSTSGAIRLGDIPWPIELPVDYPLGTELPLSFLTKDNIERFILSNAHSQEKPFKSRLKAALRLWHPDKFEGRMEPRMSISEWQSAKERCASIVRHLNQLSSAWSS